MEFAADFTAIDFETASRRSDSACQLGAVRVRGGKIVDKAMWLIRPEPFFFARTNIAIHGITPQRVESERTFGDLWEEIANQLGDDCLVAHNASFDIGVLLACLMKHNKEIPDFQYTCTRSIARQTWPGNRSYGLKPLSQWLGVRFQHHDALEDSIACAKLLLAAGIDRGVSSLESLESKLRLSRGMAGDWGKQGPAKKRRRKSRNVPGSGNYAQGGSTQTVQEPNPAYQTGGLDLQRLLVRADFIRPLDGEHVVFTGTMKTISRLDAMQLASRSGADCQDVVDQHTSIVVVSRGQPSDQREAAKKRRDEGQAIRIVSEDEFRDLVGIVGPESVHRAVQ